MAEILVVGAPAVGKATLLHGLQATRCAGSGPDLYSLRLDTKYYDADLVVQCHQARTGRSKPPALDQLQALVLVVDATSRSSYDSVLNFQKLVSGREFDIQLLVANKVDSLPQLGQDSSSIQLPAWLEEAREWCYANGFEYIEAAAGNPTVDANLHEDGEQQGVARVLAALQAHMWPSMQPKQQQHRQQQQQQPQGQHRHAAATSSAGTAAPGETSSSAAGVSDQGHTAHPPAGQHSAQTPQQDFSKADTAVAVPTTSSQQQSSAAHQQAAAHRPAAGGTAAAVDKQPAAGDASMPKHEAVDPDDNPFLDADVDDFEQLMRQVMGEWAVF
jgi:hypothetical protein